MFSLLDEKDDEKAWWEGIETLESFAYHTVAVVHVVDQNWIPKTVYCIRCAMVCGIGSSNWNAKTAFWRASMVVTYYIRLFRTAADRYFNGILMSLLLLVVEKIRKVNKACKLKYLSKITYIALNNFKNNFCEGKENNFPMRKRVLLRICV